MISNPFHHADLSSLAYPLYYLLAYRHRRTDSLSFCLVAFASVSFVGFCGGIKFRFGQEYLFTSLPIGGGEIEP
jgi:hypothetical protein